jgi:membrane protein DedA with SNARE-associated domain
MLINVIFSGSGLGSMLSGVLEGLGIPWPGAVVLTAAGTQYTGISNAAMLATLFAVTYTAGSAAQYVVGRCFRGLLDWMLSQAMRQKLDRAIEKYGQAAVLWTRPLAVGNYISIPAGIMKMNPVKFILYTFAGIWPWAFGMCVAGGVLGQYLSVLARSFPYVAAVLVMVAVGAVALKLWKRSRRDAQFGD